MPHSFIHSLTHPMMSAYSFLSRTHMPLSFADSFVHTTHYCSDLLTNRSHTPYPLCFLIFSFIGRRSPIRANNRVDTSSHASLLHVFKESVAGGVSPQLCYLRKSSALLHIGAYGLVRGQLQIVSSHLIFPLSSQGYLAPSWSQVSTTSVCGPLFSKRYD